MSDESLKLVTCYQISGENAGRIRAAFPDLQLEVASQQTIADTILQADVFCGHAKVPIDWQQVVDRGKLRWIQSSAAGLDHCLTPPVIRSGIRVSSCAGLFRDSVAEQTLALLYGLLRGLPTFFRQQLAHDYTRQPTDDLHLKTIGIVGFGGNGQRIAELLLPLGTRIVATDRLASEWRARGNLPPIEALWSADKLDDLLEICDVVILTIPLDEATRKLIGAPELARMPRGSWLINVGRGQLIDEASLVAALDDCQLAGAGLDVAYEEPLPADSRLWDLPHVIITPHVGAQSARRNDLVTDLWIENIERYLTGRRMINEVDKELGIPLPADRD